jgi:polyprenyl-phospho-N-acetylgalactosaminyl synthase
VIRHPINLGQGAALQTGLCGALKRGVAYIVTFDADGQHRTQDCLVDTYLKTGADVVLRNRSLGNLDSLPRLRRTILKLAIVFTRVTSGLRLSDAYNGLRLLTRHVAERLRILQNRMAHASELINQIGALTLTVAEAPGTILCTPSTPLPRDRG